MSTLKNKYLVILTQTAPHTRGQNALELIGYDFLYTVGC